MKNKKIIISLIILIVIALSIGIFLYIRSNNIQKQNEELELQEQKEYKENKVKEKEEKEEQVQEEKEVSCSGNINGTYIGKYSDNSINEEVTITLKDDGTYEKSIKEGEYQKGTYSIANNNISFEFVPSGAPQDVKSNYSYKISNDCSEITVRNSTFSYVAYRR